MWKRRKPSFVPMGVEAGPRSASAAPPRRPSPTPGDQLFEDGRKFAVVVRAQVVASLGKLARARAPKETAGVFGGWSGRDATGAWSVVEHLVEANELKAGPVHVRWSSTAFSAARERLLEERPGLAVLGWWHTHPAMSAVFSGVDREEQATWPREEHVGIVVGGQGDELGVYHGPSATLMARLVCAPPGAATPSVAKGAPASVDPTPSLLTPATEAPPAAAQHSVVRARAVSRVVVLSPIAGVTRVQLDVRDCRKRLMELDRLLELVSLSAPRRQLVSEARRKLSEADYMLGKAVDLKA